MNKQENLQSKAAIKEVKVGQIMQPIKGKILISMILSCLNCLFNLLALLALAGAIYALDLMSKSNAQVTILGQILSPHNLLIGAIIGAFIATFIAYFLRKIAFDQSHYAAFELETILRTNLTAHIAKLGMGTIENLGAGGLSKVVYDDVKELHVYVADSSPLYAKAYFMPLITLLLMLAIDWRLALAALAVLVLGMLVLAIIMKDRSEIMRQYNEGREQVSSAILEYVHAMPVVRSFDTGQTTFGRYQTALDNYRTMFTALWLKMGLPAKISMAVLNAMPTLAVLLWFGAYLLWSDKISFATWVATMLLGCGMAEAITPLHSLGHMLDKAKISARRILEIMDLPILPQINEATKKPQDSSVTFVDVNFAYDENSPQVLTKINFHTPPNTITALVGASGAGKTTAVKLLARFWDVTSGKVLIGGADVRDLTPETLMQHISIVFQDTFLFSSSISENISLGSNNATLDDIKAAAIAAQAHDFIMDLPQGYDTLAGEKGIFLSGGQRQRITIARAILQNRPILILDEATAFSDPENEAAIVQALAKLMQGKTVLMVAHRLSTIIDADQILFFDAGKLLEQGTHQELLAQKSKYESLWQSYQQAQNWALHRTAQI